MTDTEMAATLFAPRLAADGTVLDPSRYAGRSACVIGAGIGGLALAIVVFSRREYRDLT